MRFLNTKHERKSATLTILLGVIIMFLIFTFGLTYFDPPKEFGIAVNFGTTDFGSGNIQPKEALKPIQQEIQKQEEVVEEEIIEEDPVEEQTESDPSSNEAAENVLTQNNEEAIAIKKQEEAKRKNEADRIAKEKRKEEERKAEIERKKVAEQKRIAKENSEKAAKRKNLDALMGGFSDSSGKATGGEGDDNKAGDKGKITGDPNASGYYGNGGGGSGGNYRLGNRKALTKPKPTYDCNEEGRVFVGISVDNSGKVISAQAGVKGTTNSASCLLTRAKEAALRTKFNVDNNAPSKQIGIIIYNFSLSK
ncbi:MAG: energy transducer TonB [Flavobacteriaceae bacterium]|nr:energy transducer TonB [Flavobacteriaceae bacterium]